VPATSDHLSDDLNGCDTYACGRVSLLWFEGGEIPLKWGLRTQKRRSRVTWHQPFIVFFKGADLDHWIRTIQYGRITPKVAKRVLSILASSTDRYFDKSFSS